MKWAATIAAAAAFATPSAALANDTAAEIKQAIAAETGSVGTAPTEGLTVGSDAVSLGSIGIGLPVEDRGTITDGLTFLEGAGDDSQVAVQPTGDGVRALVNIDSPDAPERFAFAITGAAELRANEDGSVVALDAQGAEVGSFAPAWARDANGRAVISRYEIDGTTLVQVAEHRGTQVAYGVTADPWFVPAAVLIGRCFTNKVCRTIFYNKGSQAAIRYVIQNWGKFF